jgi:hypothetical protein
MTFTPRGVRMPLNTRSLVFVFVLLALAAVPAAAQCRDPLPIDPDVVTKQLKLKGFGASQAGPVCQLRWQGGSAPSMTIFGPTAMTVMGRKFTSAKEAAAQYRGESPKGVEPLPGVPNGYMVFDPKTPNRRLFVEHQKRVYMIVTQDPIAVDVLARAVRRQ